MQTVFGNLNCNGDNYNGDNTVMDCVTTFLNKYPVRDTHIIGKDCISIFVLQKGVSIASVAKSKTNIASVAKSKAAACFDRP